MIRNIISAPGAARRPAQGTPARRSGSGFGQILKDAQRSTLTFSGHAQSRLRSRGISMTPEMMGKLDRAVQGACRKGSRDSLVLLDNLAFIVNVPNRTVITAMDGRQMRESIVTNIDSTVIAD